MLNDVEFREVQEVARVDKVKIVACDGKSEFNWCCISFPIFTMEWIFYRMRAFLFFIS